MKTTLNTMVLMFMQLQLTTTSNMKDKLEERLQIITEETNCLQRKQEEYTEQMRIFIEKVDMIA